MKSTKLEMAKFILNCKNVVSNTTNLSELQLLSAYKGILQRMSLAWVVHEHFLPFVCSVELPFF